MGGVLGLPGVGPEAGDGAAVEDDEEDLGEVAGGDEGEGDLDGELEGGVAGAEAAVEAQAGDAADVEGGSVDNVGSEVLDFGCVDGGEGENILDVLYVPAGAEGEEFKAESDEDDKEDLGAGSAVSQSWMV